MPDYISEPCQDLLAKILNPEPTLRFNINQIRAHPWYNQIEHTPPYTPAVFIGKDIIPIDEKIIATLEKDYLFEPE